MSHKTVDEALVGPLGDEVGWSIDRLEMVFELLRESSCGATCASSETVGESMISDITPAVRPRSSAA